MTRFLLPYGMRNTSDSYVLDPVGRPLWREDGSVFCMCRWPMRAQSFSGPSPLGLATVLYYLRFETSFSSPPTTRRVTVEIFDPTSTRVLWGFVLFITPRHGPRRKHSLSIVEKACLQRHCIATEVIRLLLAYSLPRDCVYRAVA
jgi:hypothetical protein